MSLEDANKFMYEKRWGNLVYESEEFDKREALGEYKELRSKGLIVCFSPNPELGVWRLRQGVEGRAELER